MPSDCATTRPCIPPNINPAQPPPPPSMPIPDVSQTHCNTGFLNPLPTSTHQQSIQHSGYVASSGANSKASKRWWKYFDLNFANYIPSTIKISYELPSTVVSVRDGWQWTCQSGAVVSGLLAAVAAQLLTLFKAPPPDGVKGPAEGAQTVLLIACYSAIFLNINATISSFILIDKLGEIGFKSSSKHPTYDPYPERTSGQIGSIIKTQEQLMMDYGASRMWKSMLWHWLFTFFAGIISLIVAVLTYVVMQENLAVKVSLLVITVVNSGFLVFFIIWNVIPGE